MANVAREKVSPECFAFERFSIRICLRATSTCPGEVDDSPALGSVD
jgi:hypothetical protein